MKKYFFSALICLYVNLVFSQNDHSEWFKTIKLGGSDVVLNTIDPNGNIYTTYNFKDTIRVLDEGSNWSKITAKGKQDIYLEKRNNHGELLWQSQFGGAGYDQINLIKTDQFGHVYLFGKFSDTVDFDFSDEIALEMTGPDSQLGYFIQKIDATGHLIWVKTFSGHLNTLRIEDAVIGPRENIYVTGNFNDILDLPPLQLVSKGSADALTFKLNSRGEMEWVNATGGNSYDWGKSISIDSKGNVYTTGIFERSLETEKIMLKSNGNNDVFIKKINSNGKTKWVKQIGGLGYDKGEGILIDRNDDLYISGGFEGEVDFNCGKDSALKTANGHSDIFLLKLNTKAKFIWVRTNGSSGRDSGLKLFENEEGELIQTGTFSDKIDFDQTQTILEIKPTGIGSYGYATPFLQKFNPAGEFLNATGFKAHDAKSVKKLVLGPTDELVTFGTFTHADTLPLEHRYSFFLEKQVLGEIQKMSKVLVCHDYYWPVSKKTYSKSGTYTAKTKEGIVKTIDLQFLTQDKTVRENGLNLNANAENATFRWLDADRNYEPIEGETGAYFTIKKTGTYCVEISSDYCDIVDTSILIKQTVRVIDPAILRQYYERDTDITIRKIEREHIPLSGDLVKMIPFRQGKRYGFVEAGHSEKWLIKPRFEQVFAVYKEGAIVKDTSGGYGLIGVSGDYLIQPYFKNLFKENDVYHGMVTGAVDTALHLPESHDGFNLHLYFALDGKLLFEEHSHQHQTFNPNESLAWFRFGQTYHIRNKKGDLVKEFPVDTTSHFVGIQDDNLLFTSASYENQFYKAYDINGQLKFKLPINSWSRITKLSDDLFGIVSTDADYYFCDAQGKQKPYASTSYAVGFFQSNQNYFKENQFVLRDGDSGFMGIINRNGAVIADFKYKNIGPEINGLRMSVDSLGHTFYLDKQGKVAFKSDDLDFFNRRIKREFMLTQPGYFYEGLKLNYEPKIFIDTADNGEISRYIDFDSITYYYENIEGERILELPTDIILAGHFSEGLAPALNKDKSLGFINIKGEWAIEPKYELTMAGAYPIPYVVVPEFKSGYAYIKAFKGYIDKNGKEYFGGKRMEDRYNFSH